MDHLIEKWHKVVSDRDMDALNELLADDVLFYSPFFWKPKEGKAAAFLILSTVVNVLEDFAYHRELKGEDSVFLEFSARVGDLKVKGMDLIRFSEGGQIIEFEVMIRPANGLQAVAMEMQRRLENA